MYGTAGGRNDGSSPEIFQRDRRRAMRPGRLRHPWRVPRPAPPAADRRRLSVASVRAFPGAGEHRLGPALISVVASVRASPGAGEHRLVPATHGRVTPFLERPERAAAGVDVLPVSSHHARLQYLVC